MLKQPPMWKVPLFDTDLGDAECAAAEDAIRSRIRSQLSNEERVKHADAVIENVAGEDELRTEVTRLWHSRIDQG